MIPRLLFSCALLVVLVTAAQAGRYQRTKDRQIRVWNEHPERWDEAIWTGERDENGNATGTGILTWYRMGQSKEMGTLIPTSRGHGLQVIRSFSGTMNQGRFEGTVITNDDHGTKFQAKYADGSRVGPWIPAAEAKAKSPATKEKTALASTEQPKPPAEGPEVVRRSAVVEAPTQDSHTLEVFRPPSSLRASYVAATPPPSSPSAKDDDSTMADFRLETEGVLSRVREATANWRDIDALDAVQPLPSSVRNAVDLLADHAKGVRSTGADSAIRTQVETADALSVVNDTTNALATKDAAAANSKLSQFLKNHPSAPSENQKDLWRYLTSAQSTCERRKKEAETHLQRAQSLVTADEVNQAIDEYHEANRLFPSQATANKIHQLTSRSASVTNP